MCLTAARIRMAVGATLQTQLCDRTICGSVQLCTTTLRPRVSVNEADKPTAMSYQEAPGTGMLTAFPQYLTYSSDPVQTVWDVIYLSSSRFIPQDAALRSSRRPLTGTKRTFVFQLRTARTTSNGGCRRRLCMSDEETLCVFSWTPMRKAPGATSYSDYTASRVCLTACSPGRLDDCCGLWPTCGSA
jgi:hypothetical protein